MNNMKKEMDVLARQWTLNKIALPIKLIDDKEPPVFHILNDLLLQRHRRKQLLLPNFEKTETVTIFSDYGGESSNSKYYTYTFVFADYNTLGIFAKGMVDIRLKYGLNAPLKEISFKDLHYGPVKRCLEEFLYFSNNFINGLIFTLAVDKKVISLSGQNNKEALNILIAQLKDNGYGSWKGEVAEKHQRIVQVIAYFCKLLIGNNKKIFWMTDQDSIVANEEKADIAAQILVNAINSCKDANIYQTIGYSPRPFEEDEGLYFRDVLSISDLVAGSIEHYFTRKQNSYDQNEFTIKESADKILQWLSGQGVGLKKLTMYIDKQMHGSFIDFELEEPLKNMQFVDVEYNMKLEQN